MLPGSLEEVHVSGVARHEGGHQGWQGEVAGVDGLAALVTKAPV